MKFLKIAVLAVLALCWIAPAQAQELRTANATYLFDVEDQAKTYCVVAGVGGDPFGTPISGPGRISTSGSSTTVSEATTGDNPFEQVAVGDVLIVDRGIAGIDTVIVDARASAASVTVHTAVDWSAGYSFRYWDVTCGTDAAAGWIPVGGYENVHLAVDYTAGDLTGLDVAMECRYGGLGTPRIQVYPGSASSCGFGTLNTNVCTFTSTTFPANHIAFSVANNSFQDCRVALEERTADGAVREEVTAVIAVSRHRP